MYLVGFVLVERQGLRVGGQRGQGRKVPLDGPEWLSSFIRTDIMWFQSVHDLRYGKSKECFKNQKSVEKQLIWKKTRLKSI